MTLIKSRDIKTVGIVGGGVIGSGWASRCLGAGLNVIATDPSPTAEALMRENIENAWPAVEQLGTAPGASIDRLTFTSDLAQAVGDADFIQENVPEREDVKIAVFKDISAHCRSDVVIASSSSGLLPSRIQSETTDPSRVVIGHPFSPVYALPLVEITGGEKTSHDAVVAAGAFYKSIGMRPLHVRKEIDAYLSDRLQCAMWHEALHLIDEGIATVPEIDAAITGGPGLRWAVMGMCLAWHAAGGPGGMRHTMEQFGPTLELPWTKLKPPKLTNELREAVITGSEAEAGDREFRDIERRRDACIVGFLEVLDKNWYKPEDDGWPELATADA
ncbi:MAG: L-carnitine dehydrogenase [Rhodospirillaceae bacterium]|jgi:carnitine 3-dehydrogenase|nr:L-carnitine dehydrogenase [Rhodospirillaceae bacterium]MBT6202369.1 L-carnitine dehydrogenase [Rhodospirillaceae bacterium]MBT6512753.1 L-carnitine dehydrogenase [Rhodospirillaceae bacterium]MBT7612609.1 L-carnitine dehydrogenase [Rhodospirillaceae bacterium]MBT7648628.1 L-carnitine dehydrogenase [Rhodospirillaceae bacterium]